MPDPKDLYLPLSLSLVPRRVIYSAGYGESTPLSACQTVLQPLLAAATSAYVYRGRKGRFFLYGKWNEPLCLDGIPFLKKEKGKYKIEVEKAKFEGYECFWNAQAFKRGSIAIALPGNFNIAALFCHMYAPNLMGNPNSGNTLSAVKQCKQAMLQNGLGVLLPASNGMEYLSIYAPPKRRDALLAAAQKECPADV